jgi:hypothetical protein
MIDDEPREGGEAGQSGGRPISDDRGVIALLDNGIVRLDGLIDN